MNVDIKKENYSIQIINDGILGDIILINGWNCNKDLNDIELKKLRMNQYVHLYTLNNKYITTIRHIQHYNKYNNNKWFGRLPINIYYGDYIAHLHIDNKQIKLSL